MHETIVLHMNHMDPVWKRSWPDYAEIEGNIILKALELMKRYPGFTFVLEQAVVLDAFLKNYPDRCEEVHQRIEEGRLEIIGGAWTLVDLNMVLGESLIRNFRLGLDFLEREFNYKPSVGCFMDAFGLNAQMPQILQQFGIANTVQGRTVQLPDSPAVKPPFWWRGQDGSQILSGVDTIDCVIGLYEPLSVEEITENFVRNLEQKKQEGSPLSVCFMVSEEIPPRAAVYDMVWQKLAQQEGIEARSGTFQDYFDRTRALIGSGQTDLQEHSGEFNPVFTGTYTTRSAIKKENARLQGKLLDTEALLACSAFRGYELTRANLAQAWRHVIFNQFHDTLCGCHSGHAFRDVMKYYREADRELGEICSRITGMFPSGNCIFNPLPYATRHILEFDPEEGPVSFNGTEARQVRDETSLFVDSGSLDGFGAKPFTRRRDGDIPRLNQGNEESIENEFYRIGVKEGGICDIQSVQYPDFMLSGDVGYIAIREDKGGFWSSRPTGDWVKCRSSQQHSRVETSHLLKRLRTYGCVEGVPWDKNLRCDWEREIRLWAELDRIDFIYRMEWYGHASTVSAVFPLPLNTSYAVYETPFAVLSRPVYEPEPEAPFHNDRGGEWPSLRFVSVSDEKYGVSVVHHGSHGAFWREGQLCFNLLHAPSVNNLECGVIEDGGGTDGVVPESTGLEHGSHEFRFSLRMHEGNWTTGDALRMAEMQHHPPMKIEGNMNSSPINLDLPPNMGYSALKNAETYKDALMLRLWEGVGFKSSAEAYMPGVKKAAVCNVQESVIEELPVKNDVVTLACAPYEVKTWLLWY